MSPQEMQQAILKAADHQAAGRLDEAAGLCRQVLAESPNQPAALHLLGAIATLRGEFEQAVPLLRQVIAMQPENPGGHASLGIALAGCRKFDEAIACQDRALSLNPSYARAHCNRGAALGAMGRSSDAVVALQRALALQPNYPEALYNLGNAQHESGQSQGAINTLNRALSLRPNHPDTHYCLGNAYAGLKRYGEAIAAYQRAIEQKSTHSNALGNLAHALSSLGQLDQSIVAYRQSLAIKPDAQIHSGLILTLQYHPQSTNASIREELNRWNHEHALPLTKSIQIHDNDPTPDRRIRIGYVSPDFCRHSVSRFMLPVLEHHNRTAFEILGYSSVGRPDDITTRLRGMVDGWHDVKRLSDEQLADQIRRDRVDILVDLALHTGGNRLPAFARRPAHVQMTYLAYAGSSGMSAIDYRLTDPWLDPPGGDESGYCEKSLRLPDCFWCYQPTGDEPAIAPLPATRNGFVTFGCLNNFAKVTEPTLATWARLLNALPTARLVLHAPSQQIPQHVKQAMADVGIDPARLTLKPHLPSVEYFAAYNQIDIALDPFPFGGGTTTCDALWMGLPVVSLAGSTAVSRAGLSLLSNVGLPELVGRSSDQYIEIATNLANDLPRLMNYRATLRERMRSSVLMDAARFTRNLEDAYRTAWKSWCDTRR